MVEADSLSFPMTLHTLRHMRWLHTALKAVLLCFVLGTAAHAGHSHANSGSPEATHFQCDFCTGFGGLIDAPVASHTSPVAPEVAEIPRLPVTQPTASAEHGLPPARGPPLY
jgi:hypothetical protein